MGTSAGAASSAQQGRGGDRQQTGAHCLGRVVQRPRLSPSAPSATGDGRLMAVEKTLRLESTKRFPRIIKGRPFWSRVWLLDSTLQKGTPFNG
jgi:hypothetical protein